MRRPYRCVVSDNSRRRHTLVSENARRRQTMVSENSRRLCVVVSENSWRLRVVVSENSRRFRVVVSGNPRRLHHMPPTLRRRVVCRLREFAETPPPPTWMCVASGCLREFAETHRDVSHVGVSRKSRRRVARAAGMSRECGCVCATCGRARAVSVSAPTETHCPLWPWQGRVSGNSQRERPCFKQLTASECRVSENSPRQKREIISATCLRPGQNQGCLWAFPEGPASRGGSPRIPGDTSHFVQNCMCAWFRFFLE